LILWILLPRVKKIFSRIPGTIRISFYRKHHKKEETLTKSLSKGKSHSFILPYRGGFTGMKKITQAFGSTIDETIKYQNVTFAE